MEAASSADSSGWSASSSMGASAVAMMAPTVADSLQRFNRTIQADLAPLRVQDLKMVCRGLRLSVQGTKQRLLATINGHVAKINQNSSMADAERLRMITEVSASVKEALTNREASRVVRPPRHRAVLFSTSHSGFNDFGFQRRFFDDDDENELNNDDEDNEEEDEDDDGVGWKSSGLFSFMAGSDATSNSIVVNRSTAGGIGGGGSLSTEPRIVQYGRVTPIFQQKSFEPDYVLYLNNFSTHSLQRLSKQFDNQFKRNPVLCGLPKPVQSRETCVKFSLPNTTTMRNGTQTLLVRCFGFERKSLSEMKLQEAWPPASMLKINSQVVFDSTAAKSRAPESICLNITSGAVQGLNEVELSVDMLRSTSFFPRTLACALVVFLVDNIATDELISRVQEIAMVPYDICVNRVKRILKSVSGQGDLNEDEGDDDVVVTMKEKRGKKRIRAELDDEEEEEEVVPLTEVSIKLVDPVGFTKIEIPIRGRNCTHLQCFDLKIFIEMNRVAKGNSRWHCPVCNNDGVSLCSILVDSWFQKIIDDVPKNTKTVEILPDASFQFPPGTDLGSSTGGNGVNNNNNNDDDDDEEEDDTVYTSRLTFSEEPGPSGVNILGYDSPTLGSSIDAPIELD